MDDPSSKVAKHPALAEMQIITLKNQRDELLAALKSLLDDETWESEVRARELIAKAEALK